MARLHTPALLKDNDTSKINSDVLDARIEQEKKLKGDNDKLKPPSYMTKNSKKIFKFVVKELEESKIFGNVDLFVLEQFSNTYSKYRELEIDYTNETDKEEKKLLRKEIKDLANQLPKLYNELSLTPQSRAKIGAIKVQANEDAQDEVLKALNGNMEGEF